MTSGDALVERELRDARAREADYRARLVRHRNLSSKLRAHAALLREALRNPAPGGSIIARLLADVARLSSQALEIPRASIWLFDESRQFLVCRFQLPLPDVDAPPDGPRIATASCPGYISALARTDSGAVAVDDARHDPRTSELGAYLRANQVGALLDIPIVGPGALDGVLCHEHQGGPRSWQQEEIDFATDLGAMVALALEAERRILAEPTARGSAARYQHLVESLPVPVYSFQPAEVSQFEHQKLESLGRLAAGVAHDFNNLLMVLSAAVSTLREARSAPAERAIALAEIDGAVGQVTALTRQLLTYARREAIAPALLSIDAVVESTLPALSKLVGPELRLSHRLGAGQARVVVDESQLRQVLLDLAGNAADTTRGHGSEVRISTDLVVLEPDQARARGIVTDGTFVVLTVADDGHGIPGDLAERVFDPLFTTKEKGQGTGLGLARCESIVRRAGGFIAIESVAGRGATVRAHFPAVETEVPRVAPPRVERPAVAASFGRPRVLVVEDNEPIRNLVVRVLADEGVELLQAASLGAARATLAGTNVDVLLADGELPDGSGIELAREAVEQGRARRVILMSGADLSGARAAFIDAVVSKPFRLDGLVESVKRLLPSS